MRVIMFFMSLASLAVASLCGGKTLIDAYFVSCEAASPAFVAPVMLLNGLVVLFGGLFLAAHFDEMREQESKKAAA